MNSSWRRIAIGGAFFAVTCLTAVAGYMIAGWQLLDAIYMVVITVFGVGYGETKPLESPVLKVFTMGVIIAGCSSGIYVVGGFVQMVAEGEINRMMGTRRMSKGIERLRNHILICGFGRVGQMLAHDLATAGMSLVVIDSNEGRVLEAQRAGFLAVLGNASEEPTSNRQASDHGSVLATVLARRRGQRLHHLGRPRTQRYHRDYRSGGVPVDREEASSLGRQPHRDAGLDRRDERSLT